METQNTALIESLVPHKYPIGIYAFGLMIAVAIFVSLYFVPSYYKAAKLYHQAKISYQQKHFDQAISLSEQSLSFAPSSANVKFLLAKAYFASGGEENAKLALQVLENMKIDKYKFEQLKAVMPADYEQLFETK